MHCATTTTAAKKSAWTKDLGGHGPELDIADTRRRREDRAEIAAALADLEEEQELDRFEQYESQDFQDFVLDTEEADWWEWKV